MQSEPRNSQRVPAEWSGARSLIEKWLVRRCAAESVINLFGGAVFLVFGIAALIFTSCFTAGIVVVVLMEVNVLLFSIGIKITLFRPTLFIILFLFFTMLSVLHAYKTRWNEDSAARVDFGTALIGLRSLLWEFLSAGPILFILSVQDFSRYVRLSRLDAPQVSALLLWLFDKGGRANFAEITITFPGLNAVRVLPQLRDIPGILWWPDDGEISISDTLKRTFAEILGREPKSSPFFHSYRHERHEPKKPVVEADEGVSQWYAALNLPLFAPLKQVKAQYRKLAKIYHPDAKSSGRANGEIADDEQMKRINEAYHNILKHSQSNAGMAV
ncbi:MAG TPA: J domain-containing protein [Verrucomicrobiae bacterium]|nr:J domain-containing protein [Verrucomicrobiae bacterium]